MVCQYDVWSDEILFSNSSYSSGISHSPRPRNISKAAEARRLCAIMLECMRYRKCAESIENSPILMGQCPLGLPISNTHCRLDSHRRNFRTSWRKKPDFAQMSDCSSQERSEKHKEWPSFRPGIALVRNAAHRVRAAGIHFVLPTAEPGLHFAAVKTLRGNAECTGRAAKNRWNRYVRVLGVAMIRARRRIQTSVASLLSSV
jgi:hypothetical protein